jgi:hypothetical protein
VALEYFEFSVIALCCLQVLELLDAEEPPDTLLDMLLMAFNMQYSVEVFPANDAPCYNVAKHLIEAVMQKQALNRSWKFWMSQQFTSELAGNLYLAAAARENTEGMRLLVKLRPAALTAAVIGPALANAVQQQKTKTLEYLCKLSEAKTWDVNLLVQPLVVAMRRGYDDCEQLILGTDGLLRRLDAVHMADLLLAKLMAMHNDNIISRLAKLPQARQLQWDRFEGLLAAAVNQQDSRLFELIKLLPAQAAQMGPSHVFAKKKPCFCGGRGCSKAG